MIQAIVGRKGSGKTKRLLDMANEALKVEHGHIVFVDDDKRYMYDLRHEIRFVDASEYMPKEHRSPDALICVDAFHRLANADWTNMQSLFERLDALGNTHNCTFLLSLSADSSELPEFILKYAV